MFLVNYILGAMTTVTPGAEETTVTDPPVAVSNNNNNNYYNNNNNIQCCPIIPKMPDFLALKGAGQNMKGYSTK